MAAISKVTIFNMALSHVGASSSVEDENEASSEAAACRLWYDYARLQALEAYNWDFARQRKALAAHADDPPDEWSFRYQYPANCVQGGFRLIWNPTGSEDDAVPFAVELDDDGDSLSILTNMEDAIGIYTRDIENTAFFTPTFVRALSHFLAHLIASKLTTDGKIGVQQLQIAQAIVANAAALNANQAVEAAPREAESIRARV